MDKEHIVIAVVAAVAFILLGIAVVVYVSQGNPPQPEPVKPVEQERPTQSTTTVAILTSTTVPETTTSVAPTTTTITVTTTLATSTTVKTTTSTVITTSTSTTVVQPQVVMIMNAWKCVDSDGGENYFLRGTLTMNDRVVWTDSCLNPSQLQESFCDKTRLKTGYRTVVYDCLRGCFEGACLANETKKIVWVSNNTTTTIPTSTTTTIKTVTVSTSSTTTTTNIAQVVQIANGLFCRDTDGGKNYNLTGVVTVNDRVVWTDACLNPSELQEGYCDKSSKKYYRVEIYECPKRCETGACVQ